MKLCEALLNREKLIGMFRGDNLIWDKIPETDSNYESDHTTFDHSDLGMSGLCSGRWRFDSKEPTKVVWSDEPSKTQMEVVSDFLGKRGYSILKHHVWAFSDNPKKNRVISPYACYSREGD